MSSFESKTTLFALSNMHPDRRCCCKICVGTASFPECRHPPGLFPTVSLEQFELLKTVKKAAQKEGPELTSFSLRIRSINSKPYTYIAPNECTVLVLDWYRKIPEKWTYGKLSSEFQIHLKRYTKHWSEMLVIVHEAYGAYLSPAALTEDGREYGTFRMAVGIAAQECGRFVTELRAGHWQGIEVGTRPSNIGQRLTVVWYDTARIEIITTGTPAYLLVPQPHRVSVHDHREILEESAGIPSRSRDIGHTKYAGASSMEIRFNGDGNGNGRITLPKESTIGKEKEKQVDKNTTPPSANISGRPLTSTRRPLGIRPIYPKPLPDRVSFEVPNVNAGRQSTHQYSEISAPTVAPSAASIAVSVPGDSRAGRHAIHAGAGAQNIDNSVPTKAVPSNLNAASASVNVIHTGSSTLEVSARAKRPTPTPRTREGLPSKLLASKVLVDQRVDAHRHLLVPVQVPGTRRPERTAQGPPEIPAHPQNWPQYYDDKARAPTHALSAGYRPSLPLANDTIGASRPLLPPLVWRPHPEINPPDKIPGFFNPSTPATAWRPHPDINPPDNIPGFFGPYTRTPHPLPDINPPYNIPGFFGPFAPFPPPGIIQSPREVQAGGTPSMVRTSPKTVAGTGSRRHGQRVTVEDASGMQREDRSEVRARRDTALPGPPVNPALNSDISYPDLRSVPLPPRLGIRIDRATRNNETDRTRARVQNEATGSIAQVHGVGGPARHIKTAGPATGPYAPKDRPGRNGGHRSGLGESGEGSSDRRAKASHDGII